MNGILIVNKEQGYTSRDVVNKVGKILNTRKIGHTGTLDPIATGVLVLCIGKTTRLVELLTSSTKEYEAEVILGISTDTLDITGNILETRESIYNKNQIEEALKSMKGTYLQEVPKYSAIKIDGERLYDYARKGKSVELPKRNVNIIDISLVGDIINKEDQTIFKFKTTVSKGTYIRSLVRDIAFKLGTIGTMSKLNRTKQGDFFIGNSYSLADIERGNYKLLSISDALNKFYTICVDSELEKKVKNGVQLKNIYNQDYVLFKNNDILIALYKNDNGILKMFKYLE